MLTVCAVAGCLSNCPLGCWLHFLSACAVTDFLPYCLLCLSVCVSACLPACMLAYLIFSFTAYHQLSLCFFLLLQLASYFVTASIVLYLFLGVPFLGEQFCMYRLEASMYPHLTVLASQTYFLPFPFLLSPPDHRCPVLFWSFPG